MENVTPEILFERTLGERALLERSHGQTAARVRADGKAELFEALRPCMTGAERLLPYAELGRGLGMKEGAVKQAVRRLRLRYGELLRMQIADTVDSPDEIESEIRHLIEVASA